MELRIPVSSMPHCEQLYNIKFSGLLFSHDFVFTRRNVESPISTRDRKRGFPFPCKATVGVPIYLDSREHDKLVKNVQSWPRPGENSAYHASSSKSLVSDLINYMCNKRPPPNPR